MKRIHFLLLALAASITFVAGPRLIGVDLRLPKGDEQAGNMLDMIGHDDLRPTWAGSYLAAQFAQENFDWARASTFLEQVRGKSKNDTALTKRALVLALNAGDFDRADQLAKTLSSADDDSGIAGLVQVLSDVRAGHFATAHDRLIKLPTSTLLNFPRPIMTAWLSNGAPDLAPLQNRPNHFYHLVLIADYIDKIDIAATNIDIQSIRQTLNATTAEHIGDILLRHEKFDLAQTFYEIVAKNRSDIPHLTEKIQAAKNNTTPKNIPLFPKIDTPKAGIAAIFLDMASAFYNDNGFETAQLFAQISLALNPKLVEAQLLIADTLTQSNKLDAAIAVYHNIPATYTRYSQIQQQIAQLQDTLGRTDMAIATLEKSFAEISDRDTKITLLMQMGDIYRTKDQFSQALEKYDQAADLLDQKIDAAHWELLYARGMTRERLRQWDKAEADLTAALAYKPDHPYILNYLGYSWADQNIKLDDAVKLLERAVKLVPNDGYVTDSVGWVYYRTKKYTQAVDYLERAVELLPYDSTVNDHLGDAYMAVGRVREAKFQWQRAHNYADTPEQKKQLAEKLGITVETSAQDDTINQANHP